ncbi:MAG: hypothetical protein PHH26_05240 [Candidatus Thermoplasmatota archaeon]|nr:hypothetical protein [Candidatus Thermoplasmatota archaeon]
MSLYRLRKDVGPHRQDGREYGPGEVIESDLPLNELFRGKFDEIEDSSPTEKMPAFPNIPAPSVVKEDSSPSNPPSPKPSFKGKDETDKYPEAVSLGVSIIKNGAWYVVVDNETGDILSDRGLRRKDVDPFLQKMISEHTSDNDVEEEDFEDD